MVPVNETYSYTEHDLKTASLCPLSKIDGYTEHRDGSSQRNELLYGARRKNSFIMSTEQNWCLNRIL